MALSPEAKRGYARQILANELFVELTERKRAECIAGIRGTAPGDSTKRDEFFFIDRAWGEFIREIKALAATKLEKEVT